QRPGEVGTPMTARDPADGEGRRQSGEVTTLAKAIEILDIVGAAPHGISLAELALRLQMPKSTVHRLATALCRANFLRKNVARSVFQLGLRLTELGEIALESLELREIARPLLLRLAYDLGEIALGLHCVGAPVFNHQQVCVAAISVAGPKQRIPLERLEEISEQIVRVADLISGELGWRPLSGRAPARTGVLRSGRAESAS